MCTSIRNHLFAVLLFAASTASAELTVYPGPDPSLACDIYSVKLTQGDQTEEAFVIQSVSDWESQTYFKHIKIYETLSYAGFSFTGPITVEVTKVNPVREGIPNHPWIRQPSTAQSVIVRPQRFGIVAEVNDGTARFTIDRPGQYSVEFIDSDIDSLGCPRHGLMLFADPPEDPALVPNPKAEGVLSLKPGKNPPGKWRSQSIVRFEPGLHELGPWVVPDQVKQIYLAPGAFVLGALRIEDREDGFLLNGRGVLSGQAMEWHAIDPNIPDDGRPINHRYVRLLIVSGKGITVDGITLADSPHHTMVGGGSEHKVSWVKVIGWKYNNDGVRGYEDSVIEHCFIRANDDAIWLYDDNLTVRDVVFWQGDNGACFQLGWRSTAARNVTVRNIDLIHAEWGLDRRRNNAGLLNLRIPSTGPNGPQVQEDFLFENITVETPVIYTIDLRMRKNPGEGGGQHTLRNFTFRNLDMQMNGQSPYARAVLLPWDETHGFENFRFENIRVNGTLVTEENYANEGRFAVSPLAKAGVTFVAETEPFSWKNPLATSPHKLHQASIVRAGDRYVIAAIPYDRDLAGTTLEVWSTSRPSEWEHTATIEISGDGHPRSPDLIHHPFRNRFYLAFERLAPDGKSSSIELMSADRMEGPWIPVGDGTDPIEGSEPGLFIDGDARAYLLRSGLTLSEIDLDTGTVIDGPVTLILPETAAKDGAPVLPDNPILRKKYGTYLLFWSEDGPAGGAIHTASSPSIWGPYQSSLDNPFYGEPGTLPFASTDIFDGPDGGWWILTTQIHSDKAHYSIDRMLIDETTLAISAKQTRSEQTVEVPAGTFD